jgi:hypothetical protein
LLSQSEGEDIGGFAWPRMTFVLAWLQDMATMTLIVSLLILRLPC